VRARCVRGAGCGGRRRGCGCGCVAGVHGPPRSTSKTRNRSRRDQRRQPGRHPISTNPGPCAGGAPHRAPRAGRKVRWSAPSPATRGVRDVVSLDARPPTWRREPPPGSCAASMEAGQHANTALSAVPAPSRRPVREDQHYARGPPAPARRRRPERTSGTSRGRSPGLSAFGARTWQGILEGLYRPPPQPERPGSGPVRAENNRELVRRVTSTKGRESVVALPGVRVGGSGLRERHWWLRLAT